jgi:acyl-CoA thioesterase
MTATDPRSTTLHPLDLATQLERVDEHMLRGRSSEAYMNMVGPFGGLVNATLVRAVLEDPRRQGTPVALTVNFCAPIAEGSFEIRPALLRAGKITQHWSLLYTQGEAVVASATLVCAVRRPTFGFAPARPPVVPPASELPSYRSPVPLRWLDRFDFRFAGEALALESEPLAEPRSPRSVLWVQHAPPRALDFLSLAALSDVFFLRIFQVRGTAVPAGTVTLTSYFHAGEGELSAYGAPYLLGVSDARVFHDSFHDQTCELWAPDGRLLVSGTQLAWYRA